MGRASLLAACVALAVAACSGEVTSPGPNGEGPAPAVTSSVTTSPVETSPVDTSPVTMSPVTTSPIIVAPPELADFRLGTVVLEGRELVVAIADTPALRSQGLMNVTELLSLDGMVFVWPENTGSSFWMKDTLIPLDIAWFDSSGRFVSMLTMPPCGDEPSCPRYFAEGPYRSALEMPEGEMPDLREGSRLEFLEGF